MRRFLWGLAALLFVACTDPSGPTGRTDAQLSFVRQHPNAPPLFAARDSFWARVDQNREVRLFYQGATPADSGPEFLRLEVPAGGLLRRPDGSAFGPGDSILITVTVVNAARFQFDFEPNGLRFNRDRPARLKVEYFNGDKDFNEDGVLDALDDEIERQLDLWRRTGPGALWFQVGAVKFEDLDEVDANLTSFSQYALAW